jgi:hypothetical protein
MKNNKILDYLRPFRLCIIRNLPLCSPHLLSDPFGNPVALLSKTHSLAYYHKGNNRALEKLQPLPTPTFLQCP